MEDWDPEAGKSRDLGINQTSPENNVNEMTPNYILLCS